MLIPKYNTKTKKYEQYEIPDDWDVMLHADNMYQLGNCAQCGRPLLYADAFTSLEIGDIFGYAVCPKCYRAELERSKL